MRACVLVSCVRVRAGGWVEVSSEQASPEREKHRRGSLCIDVATRVQLLKQLLASDRSR